jgi:hypothetical protein
VDLLLFFRKEREIRLRTQETAFAERKRISRRRNADVMEDLSKNCKIERLPICHEKCKRSVLREAEDWQ